MIVALGWFFFFLFPQSKPHSPFLYSALRPVLGYFSPKFEQYKGLGYAFNLKSEREAGTNFMLLGVEKNCLSLERNNDFLPNQSLLSVQCTPRLGWEGAQWLAEALLPWGMHPCACSGLPPPPGCSGGRWQNYCQKIKHQN